MPQKREQGKEFLNKLLGRETSSNEPSSNSPVGNLSSNSLSEGTGKNKNNEASSSRTVTPLNQPSLESATESGTANPTTRDPAEEQIVTATTDANIIVTSPENPTQPFTNPGTNDDIRSLWQRALDDSELSTKERQTLQGVQGLLEPTAKTTYVSGAFGKFMEDLLKTREDEDWKFNFRGVDFDLKDVGRNIISLLDKFKDIGDIIVQFDPVHAALPWAGFRFLLKLCVDKQKTVEAILIGLEKMVFLIDQCALYELLYLNLNTEASKQLEKRMLRLYTGILKLLANAIDRLEDNHLQAVFTTEDVSDNLRKVEEIAKTVDKYAQIAETQHTRAEFDELKKLLRDLNKTNSSFQPQLDAIQQRLDQSRRSEILRWISEIPYTEHHKRISSERLSGTGNWIFSREEYSDWSHSDTSKLLLLGGIPGAGKTYTASTVIDSFLKTTERFAYFYCNRAEEDRRDPQKILATIIQQLSQGSNDGLLTPVVKIYEDRERNVQTSAKLSLEESQDLLVQFADLYPNQETTICIDAMDEMNNETALLKALKDIITRAKSVIKIFITTRMDRDIVKQFKLFPLIELQPNDYETDINDFITIKVRTFFEEKDWLDEDGEDKIRSEICGTLQTRCKGSFLLATLQIELLRQLEIKEDIGGELRKLPDALTETYDEIYRKILSQPGSSPRLALNAFRWIQCSHWQLKSEELLNVVNAEVRSTGEFHKISERVETETLLAVCQNLIILDKGLNVFRFAHLSVDEYLESKLPKQDSHLEIASICLSLVCTDDTALDTLPPYYDREETTAFKKKNLLLLYSYVCWPWHFSECGLINRDGNLLSHLWDKFSAADPAFGNKIYIIRWVRHYRACRETLNIPTENKSASFNERSSTFEECRTTITANEYALACASIFALYQVLPALIETSACTGVRQSTLDLLLLTSTQHGDLEIAPLLIEKGASVSATDEYGNTPLHQASFRGHKEVVQVLIEKGANVSATNEDGNTPLHRASKDGHKEVVQLLIDKGASVSASNGNGDTPLYTASFGGHKEVAQLLIDKGASVSATNEDGDTPLHVVSTRGYNAIAQLLIDKGASVSATGVNGDTPLFGAMWHGHMKLALLLIEKGASLSALDMDGDTPLHQAAYGGYMEVAQLLIDKGASMSATNEDGDTPLHRASAEGHKEVAQLLIDKGASVSASNGNGDTPLHRAAYGGYMEVAQLLIDKGASVSATNKNGYTPLHVVSARGYKAIALLLIDKGASVSASSEDGDTPLHVATENSRREVAQVLIDKGASVSATNKNGDTPLHRAPMGGDRQVAQLLIDKGADVSATNANGDTPLHIALIHTSPQAFGPITSREGYGIIFRQCKRSEEIARLLIDKRADVPATITDGLTLLHLASSRGHKEVVQLLIDKGVNVSATNGNSDTPLHLASSGGHKEVAQLLIDKGASVSASDENGDTPLHLASRSGYKEVAQVLIDNGASVSGNDKYGDTPLHDASSGGHTAVVQLLIDKGASMPAPNGNGDTPLHLASRSGHREVAGLLIDNGASVSASTGNGDTPLHLACRSGHKEVTQLLIDNGASVSASNGNGYTPLHDASSEGHKAVVQLLIDNGASVSASNGNGDTPLHLASRSGHKEMARLLIDNGASVSDTDQYGDTPLHRAASKGHSAVVQLLIDKGANVSTSNGDGDTPLHRVLRKPIPSSRGRETHAKLKRREEIAWLLIHKGANISAKNTTGDTPLHLATRGGYDGIAELLMNKGSTTDNL